MELFFNELSLNPIAHSRQEARERVSTLLETVRAACQAGILRQLRTQEGFKEAQLADGYTWWSWSQDSEVQRELRQYFKALATRSPFLDGLDDVLNITENFEFSCQNQPSAGLGAAFISNGLAVSLLSDHSWDADSVSIDIVEIVEDGNIREFFKDIPHASHLRHIDNSHRDWIRNGLALSVSSGIELWHKSATFFPSLVFCDAVQDQMSGLPTEALSPILRGLFCLENYCQGWTSGGFNQDLLGCASSPESGSTKQQYGQERTFLCPGGISRLFSYHVKPGQPWRIHYDPSIGPGKILVGYVGRHLRTARHGH
ncbi:MAG: hypothetical protein H7831_09140 [Magnetococcus sp. WYHC-3]